MKTVLCAINAKYTHSSLALRYLQKYNIDKDITISEFSMNDSINNIYTSLLSENADIYAFSCYIWNIELTLKIAEMLKKANTDFKIFLGGPEASYNAKELLKSDAVDYIMLGEGEKTLKDILENSEFSSISGLAGKDFYNPPAAPLNLESIPIPYTPQDLSQLKNKIIYFETSRGCPYKCSYCLSSAQGKTRYFPMEYVKKGFDLFFKENVPLVKLIDRTFNSDKKRAAEIVKYIIDNSKCTRVHFEVAPAILDDELIKLLNSAPKGMFQLEMGIQSCNPHTLKSINRKTNLDTAFKNIKKLSKDIHIHLDLIAGLPYEDLDSFKHSFNYTYTLNPDMLQLGFLKVLHGTELSDRNDIKYCSFPPYEVISTKWIRADEIALLKKIENAVDKFYNSGCFKNTLEKLNKNDAFSMFYELSTLIDNKSTSRATLYSILYSKYGNAITDELTTDFLLNNKDTKLPEFIIITKPKNFKKRYYELIQDEAFKNKYNITSDLSSLRIEAVNNKVIMADYNNYRIFDITQYFKTS